MIIDSGSTDNLVAEEMVQKLGLKRVRHPCPYRIGWLQGEHALEVKKQCLVDFQIGQYNVKYCVILWIWIVFICYSIDLGTMIVEICMTMLGM